jgi:hypothetical protein
VTSLVLGLAGCNPVYTIHSIAAATDEPSPVPDVSGLWVQSNTDWTENVLRVAEVAYDVGQCRSATVHSLGTTPIDDEPIADEICFVPVGGQVIFQLRTTGQVQLHQQYLFRFEQESMSFCADIWSDLVEWSDDHPEGSAAHGLEFARRGGGDSTELFITSRPNELLSYLEGRLSQAAQACDEADEEGHTEWMTYVRVTPPRQPDAADAADTSPSPPD